jgi:death-on-curing protein
MSVFLTTDQVTAIHDLQSTQPVRDPATLAGAVGRPTAGWDGQLIYPTLALQAAVLLIAVCQAQAFVDGNKRTAWVSCDVFLQLNGSGLTAVEDDAIVELMNRISTDDLTEQAVADWIAHRSRPRKEPT